MSDKFATREVARMTDGLRSLYVSLRKYFLEYCEENPEFASKNSDLLALIYASEDVRRFEYGTKIDSMIAAINKNAPSGATFGTFKDGRGVGWMC